MRDIATSVRRTRREPSRDRDFIVPSRGGDAREGERGTGATARVTVDNFRRAESDRYMKTVATALGGFGQFFHHTSPMPIEKQDVVRPNRDTLYSAAVFDLNAGPVTISLPNAASRFMSLQVIDEDQYAHAVIYGASAHTFSRDQIGTRYLLAAVRTFVNPDDPKDLEQVHALQKNIAVMQRTPGRFDVPNWDDKDLARIRDALTVLGETVPDSKRMFGMPSQVDAVRHLIGTAIAWGGNPEKDAMYLNVTPEQNDGKTVYRLVVRDVPVDGFWSISVYNARGYFEPNDRNAYSLNNFTARRERDNSIVIQFGALDDVTPNCLPITPDWNYMVRLYRPRAEILSGSWVFPEALPAE